MSSATRAYIFAQSINELFVQPWRRFSRKAEGCRRDPNLVKNVDIAPHADFRCRNRRAFSPSYRPVGLSDRFHERFHILSLICSPRCVHFHFTSGASRQTDGYSRTPIREAGWSRKDRSIVHWGDSLKSLSMWESNFQCPLITQ